MRVQSEEPITNANLTHTNSFEDTEVDKVVSELKSKILQNRTSQDIATTKMINYLDMLAESEFGRFIIINRGANGYWTDQILSYEPEKKVFCNPIEEFIFAKSPIAVSTRDRFNIFQRELQSLIKDNSKVASIPCGLMRDLITLNYTNKNNVQLFGIDIDNESIELAGKLARESQCSASVQFTQGDAWDLPFDQEIDIITSNGLNVYESDKAKLIQLYRGFLKALKPGGSLVIGVITHPPGSSFESLWDLNLIPQEDLELEKILFSDILNLKWMNFRTEEQIYSDFKEAGFSNIKIHYDRRRIFPTVIAKK